MAKIQIKSEKITPWGKIGDFEQKMGGIKSEKVNSFHVTLILYGSVIRYFWACNCLIISFYFRIFVLTHDLAAGFIIVHSEKKVAQNEIA